MGLLLLAPASGCITPFMISFEALTLPAISDPGLTEGLPAWFPYTVANGVVEGLPSFITVLRVASFAIITKTALRKLHDAVQRRKRVGEFLWWPEDRFDEIYFPYALMKGMIVDGELHRLARLHAQVNRGAVLKQGHLFEPLHVTLMDGGYPNIPLAAIIFLETVIADDETVRHEIKRAPQFLDANEGIVELEEWFRSRRSNAFIVQADEHHEVDAPRQEEPCAPIEAAAPTIETIAAAMPEQVDVKLPGVEEAERLAFEIRASVGFLCRHAETLSTIPADDLDRSHLRPMSTQILDLSRAVRRRRRLLAGPVEMTAQLNGLRQALASTCGMITSDCLNAPWQLPRDRAADLLHRMRALLNENAVVADLDQNIAHMNNLLGSKKGKSVEAIKRRIAKATVERDDLVLVLHDKVDALLDDITAAGEAISSIELGAGPDPMAEILHEVAEARKENAELLSLVDEVEQSLSSAEAERDEAWARVQVLQAALATQKRASGALEPKPDTLESLVEWAETSLGSHVVVLPKALKETRKTRNVNVPRLHEALLFLRDVYVPMRCGAIDLESYQTALREARFDETPCFANTASANAFDGYWITWKGERRLLDRHLKWGIGTQMETMLRVYFHFDAESATVVVGHMPTHLDNWNTN